MSSTKNRYHTQEQVRHEWQLFHRQMFILAWSKRKTPTISGKENRCSAFRSVEYFTEKKRWQHITLGFTDTKTIKQDRKGTVFVQLIGTLHRKDIKIKALKIAVCWQASHFCIVVNAYFGKLGDKPIIWLYTYQSYIPGVSLLNTLCVNSSRVIAILLILVLRSDNVPISWAQLPNLFQLQKIFDKLSSDKVLIRRCHVNIDIPSLNTLL